MVKIDTDLAAIRRQLEYYFSDSNLPRDKFLRAKTEENEQGFVDISVLLTFKRLQALGATLTSVAAAVTDSTLLALNDDLTRVRRTTPLPQVSLFDTRAVYAKGWIARSQPPSIDELVAMFSPSGKVLSVKIRRFEDQLDKKKYFKGSVFVEMESAEAADRVIAEQYEIEIPNEDGTVVKKPLILKLMEDYRKDKKEEERERLAKIRLRGQKRKREERDSVKKEQDGHAVAKDESAEYKAISNKSHGTNRHGKSNDKDRQVIPGLILRFEGFGPDVTREDIREVFETHGEIAWVDFQRGNSEGCIRFARSGDAKAAQEAMEESKMQFGGKEPVFAVLGGEAEEAYWKEMWDKKDAMAEHSRKKRRENGRGGSGGRGNGRRFRGRGKASPRGRART